MTEKEMEFFVTGRDKREREGKTEYVLTFKNGKGDTLRNKRETAAVFEGFPLHMAVTLVIKNPQIKLPTSEEE